MDRAPAQLITMRIWGLSTHVLKGIQDRLETRSKLVYIVAFLRVQKEYQSYNPKKNALSPCEHMRYSFDKYYMATEQCKYLMLEEVSR